MPSRSSRANFAHLRRVALRIEGSDSPTPLDTVRALLAMQAQDFTAAKWAVGLRTPASTLPHVDAAITRGTIVRSWPIRGTLHLTAADDLPWLLRLSAPRMVSSTAHRLKNLDLDIETLERTRTIAERALEGGKQVTRADLLATFAAKGIATDGQRGAHMLWYLAQTGTLCFAPFLKKEQTFVHLDTWLAQSRIKARHFEPDEAFGELVWRYFVSHGPASLVDIAAWAKISLKETKTGLALAEPHLRKIEIDGTAYWMARDLEERAAKVASEDRFDLLPAFDEYALGYRDRTAVLAIEHKERIVPGGNGMFLPMVVAEGQIVGTWKRVVKPREITVEMNPFAKWTSRIARGVERAATAYGAFMGLPVRVFRA